MIKAFADSAARPESHAATNWTRCDSIRHPSPNPVSGICRESTQASVPDSLWTLPAMDRSPETSAQDFLAVPLTQYEVT